jgi:hypothetical protein
MLGDSLAGALVDDSEDNGIVAALMAAMETNGLLTERRLDASLFTATAATMNAQAAEIAHRLTDSAYYTEADAPTGPAPTAEPPARTAPPASASESASESAPESEPAPTGAFTGPAQQPSLWDSGLWGDEENGEPPEIDLTQAAKQAQLVQASLPGF